MLALLLSFCPCPPTGMAVHAFNNLLNSNNKSGGAGGGGKVPIVDDWRILSDGKLTGKVRGHPVIPDGDTITTSPLSNPDFANRQGVVVTTLSGSKYKLLQPQAGYLKRATAAAKAKNQPPTMYGQQSPTIRRKTLAVTKDLDKRVAESARVVALSSTSKEKRKTNKPKAAGTGGGLVVSDARGTDESCSDTAETTTGPAADSP